MKKSMIRNIIIITVSGFALLSILFLLGPRVSLDYTIRPLNLPENLDEYLANSETKVPNLISETQKSIVWADKVGVQTPLSIVYFPGYSATRQEIVPLPEMLAKSLNANLFYTRFTGHGRDGKAMLEGSVDAWMNDAHEALEIGRRLGKKVIIVAMSTGCTIATILATLPDAQWMDSLIFFSPNYALYDKKGNLLAWPWGGLMAELFIGKERSWEPKTKEQEMYWTTRYPTRSLLAMIGVVKLVESVDFSEIKVPVQIIYSPEDQVVDATVTEARFKEFGSARKELFPFKDSDDPSDHILVGDIISPSTNDFMARKILQFIQH